MSDPIRVGGGFWTCEKCGQEYHASEMHDCPGSALQVRPLKARWITVEDYDGFPSRIAVDHIVHVRQGRGPGIEIWLSTGMCFRTKERWDTLSAMLL